MPGKTDEWPAWPEYTKEDMKEDKYQLDLKKEIVKQYGEEAIRASWLEVCETLLTLTNDISAKGTDAIPVLTFEELLAADQDTNQRLRDASCFVVRNVISEGEAKEWYTNLKTLLAENKGKISGWPKENPAILRMYYSAVQMAARSHPNQMRVQKQLNELWSGYDESCTSDPLSYCDAARVRPPGIPFYGLGPHIDAGSLCRWADGPYRSFYDAVFSGKPSSLDLYDIQKRKDADQNMFEGGAQSTVLRTFQGWTALTKAGRKEGSLLLYPNAKTSIAYVLLRPFFQQPTDERDMMDATKWTFDVDSSWFPGTEKDDSQYCSPISHPHLRLKQCMVNIPTMYPGDTVWWHSDMLHAVEVEHSGSHDASVIYLASTPNTSINRSYIKRQLACFLEGKNPPDFAHGGDSDERLLKGYVGERAIRSEAGRRAFGFGL